MQKEENKPKRSIFPSRILESIRGQIEKAGIWIDDRLSATRPMPMDTVRTAGIFPEPVIRSSQAGAIAMNFGTANRETDSFKVRNQSGDDRVVTIRRNNNSPEVALTGRGHRSDERLSSTTRKKPTAENLLRNMGGKRVSMENPGIMAGGMETFTQFSRSAYWQTTTLSSRFNTDNFSKININELAELLTDLSPEVSAALWYYLICCNSGYTISVTKPGSVDGTPYVEAQAYLDKCLKTLGSYHGTLNTYFDKTFMCIFMRGGFLFELVLMENGKDFADIAAPDTKTLTFKRITDPIRGQVWDYGQYQNGTFVSLDIPTVRYVPLHPLPGQIEGRPMISPVFFTAIFLMSVLRDLKRVIQQQGYMRLDLEVVFEKLRDSMPEDAQNDPEIFKTWADGVIADIENHYGDLEPDDAYIHPDAVKVNAPVGTASANSLTAMDSLFGILERMAVRALKTLPSLLGLQDSGTNQGAENRKFEFYQKGNETIQRMVETGFGDECELALQAAGYQAKVSVKFAQMRASEELRDLQVANLKSQVARSQYDNGWISQDEAAKYATDKDKADQESPRAAAPSTAGSIANIQTTQPESGINRFFELLEKNRMPNLSEISNAMDIWKNNAPDNFEGLIEAGLYEEADA